MRNKKHPKVEVSCRNCGKKFLAHVSRLKVGKRAFCSFSCYNQACRIAKREERTCLLCGTKWSHIISQGTGKYCSYACSREARRATITTKCLTCGNDVFTTKIRQQQGRGKYCSSSCYWKSLELPIEKHREREARARDRWRFGGNRQKVLKRDNYQCQHCFTSNDLVIHHIDGTGYKSVRDFKKINNHPENLLTLCRGCHTTLHESK